MCENSKHTSDERYLRTEAKIQNAIDTMLINRKVVTKVRDFCVSAGINPATFYGHYENIGEVIFERDRREAESLRQYLANTSNLEIAFQKTFRYIDDHKTYFKSITTRDNICPYKNLVITLNQHYSKTGTITISGMKNAGKNSKKFAINSRSKLPASITNGSSTTDSTMPKSRHTSNT